MNLNDKIALVTSASRGIGKGITLGLASDRDSTHAVQYALRQKRNESRGNLLRKKKWPKLSPLQRTSTISPEIDSGRNFRKRRPHA